MIDLRIHRRWQAAGSVLCWAVVGIAPALQGMDEDRRPPRGPDLSSCCYVKAEVTTPKGYRSAEAYVTVALIKDSQGGFFSSQSRMAKAFQELLGIASCEPRATEAGLIRYSLYLSALREDAEIWQTWPGRIEAQSQEDEKGYDNPGELLDGARQYAYPKGGLGRLTWAFSTVVTVSSDGGYQITRPGRNKATAWLIVLLVALGGAVAYGNSFFKEKDQNPLAVELNDSDLDAPHPEDDQEES